MPLNIEIWQQFDKNCSSKQMDNFCTWLPLPTGVPSTHPIKNGIMACIAVQAVVQANSQSNWNGQILTPVAF